MVAAAERVVAVAAQRVAVAERAPRWGASVAAAAGHRQPDLVAVLDQAAAHDRRRPIGLARLKGLRWEMPRGPMSEEPDRGPASLRDPPVATSHRPVAGPQLDPAPRRLPIGLPAGPWGAAADYRETTGRVLAGPAVAVEWASPVGRHSAAGFLLNYLRNRTLAVPVG